MPPGAWTRARRAPPHSQMPKPLRGDSPEELWGLEGLSYKDKTKVKAANNMVIGAFRVIRRALKLRIPGYLENPLTSRLWKLPQFQKWIDAGLGSFVTLDMCQYGTPWRKRTRTLRLWSLPYWIPGVFHSGIAAFLHSFPAWGFLVGSVVRSKPPTTSLCFARRTQQYQCLVWENVRDGLRFFHRRRSIPGACFLVPLVASPTPKSAQKSPTSQG